MTYRNPAIHAKITTTIDVISGGRAIHGLGAGWFEGEHDAYGFHFGTLGERFERLEDALNIARAMFTQERATYEGKHHSVRGAYNNPKPIRGDIPIMIGGSGEKKTLRMVAQYADASNFFGDAERIKHLVGVLEGHCERLDRDPSEITKTRLGTIIVKPTQEEADGLFERMANPAGCPPSGSPPGSWAIRTPSPRSAANCSTPGSTRSSSTLPDPRPRGRRADREDARAAMLGRPQRA